MAQIAALGFGIWQFAVRASEGLNTSYDKLDAGLLLPQYVCSCLGSSFTSAAVFVKDQRVKIALVATGLIGSYAGTSLNLARLAVSIRHDEGHRNF
jgi:hypothetical protein